MADYDSSMPVYTRTDGDVAVDVTPGGTAQSASNPLYTQLCDGAGNTVSIKNYATAYHVSVDIAGTAGAAFSATDFVSARLTNGTNYIDSANPLPVSTSAPSSNFVTFASSTAVATGTSVTLVSKTQTTGTIYGNRIQVGASGAFKVLIQTVTGPTATPVTNTKAVAFAYPAMPQVTQTFENYLQVTCTDSGNGIKVVAQNRDEAAMDIYGRIDGHT